MASTAAKNPNKRTREAGDNEEHDDQNVDVRAAGGTNKKGRRRSAKATSIKPGQHLDRADNAPDGDQAAQGGGGAAAAGGAGDAAAAAEAVAPQRVKHDDTLNALVHKGTPHDMKEVVRELGGTLASFFTSAGRFVFELATVMANRDEPMATELNIKSTGDVERMLSKMDAKAKAALLEAVSTRLRGSTKTAAAKAARGYKIPSHVFIWVGDVPPDAPAEMSTLDAFTTYKDVLKLSDSQCNILEYLSDLLNKRSADVVEAIGNILDADSIYSGCAMRDVPLGKIALLVFQFLHYCIFPSSAGRIGAVQKSEALPPEAVKNQPQSLGHDLGPAFNGLRKLRVGKVTLVDIAPQLSEIAITIVYGPHPAAGGGAAAPAPLGRAGGGHRSPGVPQAAPSRALAAEKSKFDDLVGQIAYKHKAWSLRPPFMRTDADKLALNKTIEELVGEAYVLAGNDMDALTKAINAERKVDAATNHYIE